MNYLKRKRKENTLVKYPHKNCIQLKQLKIKQKQKQILTKLNQHNTRSINSSGSTIPGNGAINLVGQSQVHDFLPGYKLSIHRDCVATP